MDFAALPALFAEIHNRAEAAAVPVAGKIGKTYEKHLVDVTLVESGTHVPVTQTPAAPGAPPALMPGGVNGSLRGSVTMAGPWGGGGIGESSVSPHVIYAAVQEFGADISAKRGPYLWLWIKYIGPGEVKRRGWLRESVHIPERSYMRRAVRETVASGVLSRAAEGTFVVIVWG